MGKYGPIIEDFYTERTRILSALSEEQYKHIVMRLIGALAFRTHCEKYGYIQDKLGRVFTDFDFVAYPKYSKDITRVLTELGYEEDKQVTQLFGDKRMIFHDPAFGRHIDIFYNYLDFCHTINFIGRLEAEEITIPLAELFLEKMQIVQINEKDIIDSIMLLLEHPFGEGDKETINITILINTLTSDWGWWRTTMGNLQVVDERLNMFANLSPEERQIVHSRIEELRKIIDAAPKSMKWKIRSKVGEKVKWYKDVEELTR
ncbi:MAG: hypothetical protein ABFD14_05270 [Anaerolineaceae bacterium]|jgi:hypothetical protein